MSHGESNRASRSILKSYFKIYFKIVFKKLRQLKVGANEDDGELLPAPPPPGLPIQKQLLP